MNDNPRYAPSPIDGQRWGGVLSRWFLLVALAALIIVGGNKCWSSCTGEKEPELGSKENPVALEVGPGYFNPDVDFDGGWGSFWVLVPPTGDKYTKQVTRPGNAEHFSSCPKGDLFEVATVADPDGSVEVLGPRFDGPAVSRWEKGKAITTRRWQNPTTSPVLVYLNFWHSSC